MQPIPNPQHSAVINCSIPVQLIDQFPAAVVVINCPPLRGTINRLPPGRTYWPPSLPKTTPRSLAAILGYAEAEPIESITGKKRHRLTTAKSRVLSGGGANVLYF
jgi:hypothetical protein